MHQRPAEALEKAAALIERCGATTMLPALCEWRAELASVSGDADLFEQLMHEAKQGYEALGAHSHVARIALEIG
jgi:hypothetical protein